MLISWLGDALGIPATPFGAAWGGGGGPGGGGGAGGIGGGPDGGPDGGGGSGSGKRPNASDIEAAVGGIIESMTAGDDSRTQKKKQKR